MAEREALTADYVRSILNYNPETGVLTWRERPREHFASLRAQRRGNTLYAGKIAGSRGMRGYWIIGIGKRCYAAHRLAWLWMTGEWPAMDIDHKDGCDINNRWENLRQATESQNMWNSKTRSDNKTGFKGVVAVVGARSTKYISRISVFGERINLGTFDAAEDANVARSNAETRLHGDFARKP